MWQGREEVGSQLQSRWAQSASRGGSQVSRWGQLYELFRFSPVNSAHRGLRAGLEVW